MLNCQESVRFSPFIDLYDILVKPDNKLRVFHDEVDFSFIRERLADKYSSNLGKYAVDPVKLLKCLILKEMTEFSDVDLMEEVRVNMGYKYFLDMLPEDEPFDASLLSYFRRQRLKDCDLLRSLLDESLRLALEKGVLKRQANGKVHLTVAIDSTHTESLGRILSPCDGVRYFCNKLAKAIREAYDDATETQWGRAPKFTGTEDAVAYARDMLARAIAAYPECTVCGKTRRYYNRLAEALEDIADHGWCSPSDRDARRGHKSSTTSFDGYKEHLAMDVDTQIIVEAEVTSGEASDTPVGERMVDRMAGSDTIVLERVIGDGSYGSTEMVKKAARDGFDLVATPNHMLGSSQSNYQAKGFTYNKDCDMLVCPAGHMAIRDCVRHYKKEGNRAVRMFYFDVQRCRTCSRREGCYTEGAKSKSCSVSLLTDLQKEYLEKTKTDEFKERFKRRTVIERGNGELKGRRRPGLRKAMYNGKEMMTVQTAVAVFTHNLKKILLKKEQK